VSALASVPDSNSSSFATPFTPPSDPSLHRVIAAASH
jgi:hypothetical protein